MPTIVLRLEPPQYDGGLISMLEVASGKKKIYLLLLLYPLNSLGM